MIRASYLELRERGELKERTERSLMMLSSCRVCPRNCNVDRSRGEVGVCGIGDRAVVASFGPHYGEEGPLVGIHGSGTIFFSGCNLSCCFCQNRDISTRPAGREMGPRELAGVMTDLQMMGCHNINLVSPSHVVPLVLESLEPACEMGLRIPLVYNTGGYDSLETLRLLDGVVDIYMPDMKYSDPSVGMDLSGVPDYPEVNRTAVKEMHRQTGNLEVEDGIARRGLIIRHLVLPSGMAGTDGIVRFLADEVSRDTYINIMDQYRPEFMAAEHEGLDRRITSDEYGSALSAARAAGLWRFA